MAIFDHKEAVVPTDIGTIIYTIKDSSHLPGNEGSRSLRVRAELLDAEGKTIDSVRGDISSAIPVDERTWLIDWMTTMRTRFHNRVIEGSGE